MKKQNAVKAVVVGSSLTAAGSALAAVPASVGTAFTDLQADLLTVAGYAVTLVAATVGIWMLIKYLKRGAHTA
ncbi:MAG: major capsid protein [Gammaproteobacteria bacterium]